MCFCVAWLTVLMVHNTIPFQLHGVIIRTFWCPKERTCERVEAQHPNVPTQGSYGAVESRLAHVIILGAHLTVRDHLKFKKYHQLNRLWVGCLTCSSFHICWKLSGFGVGTCDSCCHLRLWCVSQRALSVLWCWGDAEEERFCHWLDLLPHCFIQFSHLPSSCHCISMSILPHSTVDYRGYILHLSLPLLNAVADPGL